MKTIGRIILDSICVGAIISAGLLCLGFFGGCETPEQAPTNLIPRDCGFQTLVGYGYMESCANGNSLCFLYDGSVADSDCVYRDARSPDHPFYCAKDCN
jgi:hypothetical protein